MVDYSYWNQRPESDFRRFLRMRKSVLMNTIMIAVNVLVFLLTEITGSSLDSRHLINWGAAYTPFIEQGHEYYRLFTCMFLHFGLAHLGNNMLVLAFLGDSLEREVGRIRYLLIYLIGGIGASYISYYAEIRGGEAVVSAGASGAVFAVIGALIYVVMRNRVRLGNFTTRQLVFLAALTLYHGFTSAGVDNAAHFGGLLCGFALGIILYHGKKRLPS